MRRGQSFPEVIAVAFPDYDRCALTGIGANPARVVKMMVGQHDVPERFARIFQPSRLNDPVGKAVIARCIESHEGVTGSDNERVMRSPCHQADIRPDIGERQRAALVHVKRIGIEIKAAGETP